MHNCCVQSIYTVIATNAITESFLALQQPPRYPNEGPLQARSDENDKSAIKLARLAHDGLVKKRLKSAKRRKSHHPDEDSNTTHDNVNSDKPTPREVEVIEETDQGDLGTLKELTKLELPLRSVYDGTGAWPKRMNSPHGAEQLSWANIGFPEDESLVVEDIETSTYIDRQDPSIIQLSDDIINIKTQPSVCAADDGKVATETNDNRTIELFKLHGQTVCKIQFTDCKVSNSSYSTCKTSKDIEKAITRAIGKQPSVSTVQWVAAHVILAQAGQLGGRTDDYWMKARDLAQQQLHLNPDLEHQVQQQIATGIGNDPAFTEVLDIVKQCIKNSASNPYFQSKRDKYAAANGIFYHIKDKDIVMVLDRDGEVVLFQLSDAFAKLLAKHIEHKAVQAIEMYSTLHAAPLPDMTRPGLHYMEWLVDHPEFDFRNPQNDPRVAKSGVYHFGIRCSLIDPDGTKNPSYTRGLRRDTPNRLDDGFKLKQFMKLRYGALGACTEMLSHVFGLLDPDLLEEYKLVAKEVTKLRHLQIPETRERDDPFVLRALLVNLMTNEHRDVSDWHHGFAGLVPVGTYQGGDLLVRELGLQIESKPGCLQLLRGRELRHSITQWSGRRFVVVNTTHEAVKRWAFRRLGKSVSQDTPDVNDCLDVNQEDSVPETNIVLTEIERVPERYMAVLEHSGASSPDAYEGNEHNLSG